MSIKNVYIEFYDNKNFGDDLFIYLLLKLFPQANFIVQSENLKRWEEQHQNLTVLTPKRSYLSKVLKRLFPKSRIGFLPELEAFRRIMSSSKMYLIIGGSLFIEKNKRNFFHDSLIHKVQAKKSGQKYIILSSNFGPFSKNSFLEYFSSVFLEFDEIVFRDSKSIDFFSLDNARVLPDFGMCLSDVLIKNPISTFSDFTESVVPSIGVIAIDPAKHNIDETVYVNNVHKLIGSVIMQHEVITLISFCEKENDLPFITNILLKHLTKSFPNNECRVVSYDGDVEKIIIELSRQSLIITSRFHGAIVSEVLQKPYIALYYSEKFSAAFSEINNNGVFIDASREISDSAASSCILKSKDICSGGSVIASTKEYVHIVEHHLYR